MAKEIENGAKVAKKEKKENIFKRAGKRIAKWFREMKSELKKVVWPTRKQTVNNTVVACVVMVAFGVCLWVFDQLALVVVNALISIG